MKIDLSDCSVVELRRHCTLRITGEATIVGVRGQQWATINRHPEDTLLVEGSELAVGRGEHAVVVGMEDGAVRVLESKRDDASGRSWYEAFTQRWIGWFSEASARRHAERQWGAV